MPWATSAGGSSPSYPGFGMFDCLDGILGSEDTQLKCMIMELEPDPIPGKEARMRHIFYSQSIFLWKSMVKNWNT